MKGPVVLRIDRRSIRDSNDRRSRRVMRHRLHGGNYNYKCASIVVEP